MCFLTPHNIADRLSLEQIADGPRELSIMLNFWEHILAVSIRKNETIWHFGAQWVRKLVPGAWTSAT